MHAYLITGTSIENRQKALDELVRSYNVDQFNRINFSPKGSSIGIEIIHDITNSIRTRTGRGQTRAIIVEEADLMTQEAQNAFLKTLEEPPRDTIIILSASSDDRLLDTIRSRCLLITTRESQVALTPEILQEQEELFNKLSSSGIGEKIKFVEEVGKSREGAINFIEGQLSFIHHQLHQKPLRARSAGRPAGRSSPTQPIPPNSQPPATTLTHALFLALRDLRSNVNTKMVLFELFKQY